MIVIIGENKPMHKKYDGVNYGVHLVKHSSQLDPGTPDSEYPGICGKSPGFLWFCPDFCDSVHVQCVMELFAKQQKNAEYKLTRINTEMLVLYGKYLDFCPDFC